MLAVVIIKTKININSSNLKVEAVCFLQRVLPVKLRTYVRIPVNNNAVILLRPLFPFFTRSKPSKNYSPVKIYHDSSVNIVTRLRFGQLRNRRSIPGKSKTLFSLPQPFKPVLETKPPPIHWVPAGSLRRGKAAGT